MSAQVKEALVNEALEISNLFTQNCALKHGLPEKPTKRSVSKLPEDQPPVVKVELTGQAAKAATISPSPGAGAVADAGASLLRRAAPFFLATAIGSGAGPLAWWLTKDNTTTPVVEQSKTDGSVLQWLEDNGFHRPENE